MEFPRPIVTVDVVPIRLSSDGLEIGLLERTAPPFEGAWTLPGGWIRPEEDASLEGAVLRVLNDKADVRPSHLEQLQTFAGVERDARGWSVSIAHLATVRSGEEGKLAFHPLTSSLGLPFDHGEIVQVARDRLRSKSTYSSMPLYLLGETFTLPEAHAAYERVIGSQLDPSSFRRKIVASEFVEETGESRPPTNGARRPTRLYRARASEGLSFVARNFSGSTLAP